jgi:hypothetical protein
MTLQICVLFNVFSIVFDMGFDLILQILLLPQMKEEGNFSSPQNSPLPLSAPAAERTKKIGQTEGWVFW